jgi:hypothetical protein
MRPISVSVADLLTRHPALHAASVVLEVQCVGGVPESSRLVIGRDNVDAARLDAIDECQESLATFQLPTADIKVVSKRPKRHLNVLSVRESAGGPT